MTLLCLFLVSLAVGGAHAFTLCGWARSWTLAVRRRQFPQQREADDHPESDWAIVIPARNEANHLTNLLDDLNATLQDHDVNIWVVDDQSEDDTVQVAQQHRLARTGRLRVVGNRGVGKVGNRDWHGAWQTHVGCHAGRRRALDFGMGVNMGACVVTNFFQGGCNCRPSGAQHPSP